MADSDAPEILDITTYTADKRWLENIFRDVSKLSVAKQTVVGGISGWCAGMLFAKVGKVAAATVGTSLLLLQIKTFFAQNVFLASGFAGGFLLGLSS
uniref:FUN14 domain-containing protein 1 n=1 Tax=Octopus bimaculoides TaxID=37653 RepID=A0A0L8GJ49_OCTBM